MAIVNIRLDSSKAQDFDLLDFSQNPDDYRIIDLKKPRFCVLCRGNYTIEAKNGTLLFKCKCGTTYWYSNGSVRFRPSFTLKKINKLKNDVEGDLIGRTKIPARTDD